MSNSAKQLYPVPRRTSTIGMLLFLASLTVLFAASLVGYFAIRIIGPKSPSAGTLHLPGELWLSTLVIITSSITMGMALRAVRHEKQQALRKNLVITLGLALLFTAIQIPALTTLLRDHFRLETTGMRLYGLLFVLIMLHALHVIGGLVSLGIVTRNAYHNRYDHEHYIGVRSATWYWHFLDAVWIVMFFSLWMIG